MWVDRRYRAPWRRSHLLARTSRRTNSPRCYGSGHSILETPSAGSSKTKIRSWKELFRKNCRGSPSQSSALATRCADQGRYRGTGNGVGLHCPSRCRYSRCLLASRRHDQQGTTEFQMLWPPRSTFSWGCWPSYLHNCDNHTINPTKIRTRTALFYSLRKWN